MNKGKGFWTEENIERVREWWEVSGYTCGRIKEEFGRLGSVVTTNMVIGKVHRLKLIPPPWKAEKVRKRQAEICKVRRAMSPKPERQDIIMGKKYNPRRPPEVKVSLANGKPTLLKHSKDGQCKYIVGYVDGRCEDAMYCGQPTKIIIKNNKIVASPWCDYHKSICVIEDRRPKNVRPHRSYR